MKQRQLALRTLGVDGYPVSNPKTHAPMDKLFFRTALILVIFATALAARATPIGGDLSFSGTVTLNGPIGTATKATKFSNFKTETGTGDFAVIPTGTVAATAVSSGNPWIFDPSTPLTDLWNVWGYQFDLAGSTVSFHNAFALVVEGTGRVSKVGFDSTYGTWNFTANAPNVGGYRFSFSAGTSVADGGATAILLGAALAALAMAARWRKLALLLPSMFMERASGSDGGCLTVPAGFCRPGL